MPIMRYFLYVGAVLLGLLFVSDAYFPKTPIAEASMHNSPALRIHIHSDRKWPERVVYDTSLPTLVPAPTVATTIEASSVTTPGETVAKPQVRAAFAQVQPSDSAKPKSANQPKRRIAKRHTPPNFMVAQRPQFRWYW